MAKLEQRRYKTARLVKTVWLCQPPLPLAGQWGFAKAKR